MDLIKFNSKNASEVWNPCNALQVGINCNNPLSVNSCSSTSSFLNSIFNEKYIMVSSIISNFYLSPYSASIMCFSLACISLTTSSTIFKKPSYISVYCCFSLFSFATSFAMIPQYCNFIRSSKSYYATLFISYGTSSPIVYLILHIRKVNTSLIRVRPFVVRQRVLQRSSFKQRSESGGSETPKSKEDF